MLFLETETARINRLFYRFTPPINPPIVAPEAIYSMKKTFYNWSCGPSRKNLL